MAQRKFKVGDKIKCIESCSVNQGGPIKGEIFTVSVIKETDGGKFQWVGFPLERLNSSYDSDVASGIRTNWGSSLFTFAPIHPLAKIYYGEN